MLKPQPTIKKKVRRNCIKTSNGDAHSMILDGKKNELWAKGHNEYGQLGLGDQFEYRQLMRVPLTCLDFGETVVNVKCGPNQSFLLSDKGNVYGCGLNGRANLGMVHRESQTSFARLPNLTGVVKMECIPYGSVALTQKGQVFRWGPNERAAFPQCFPSLTNIVKLKKSERLIATTKNGCSYVLSTKEGRLLEDPQQIIELE